MGRPDNLPENFGKDANTADAVLKTMTQNLKMLQNDIVAQLSQDVKRLHAEKSRLLDEIEKLSEQQQALQSEHQILLSQRQIAQQQLWAKQLAQALATHLQALLIQQMNENASSYVAKNGPNLPPTGNNSENAYRLLTSLDTTLSRTLNSVRQDLNSYQSALSQQINRMQNLEQQGEAILEALVGRLSQQLQSEAAHHQSKGQEVSEDSPHLLEANHYSYSSNSSSYSSQSSYSGQSSSTPPPPYQQPSYSSHPSQHKPTSSPLLPVPPSTAPEPAVASGQTVRQWRLSQFWVGFWLIVSSTLALSLHNVIVRIIGTPSSIFGAVNLGGYISLTSLGNSLLILFMRMVIVAPGMALLAGFLYPSAWKDIKMFALSKDRRLLITVVGSGGCLFLSQVLIYIAFGEFRNPGIPVTILFMYPIITVPLAWVLFGDRPSNLRWAVMGAILFGVVLTAFPSLTSSATISWLGITTAITSGLAFAFYLIFMQSSFRKLHPVPVSVIQFSTIFFLTCLSLLLPLGPKVLPGGVGGFLGGVVVLGTLTLVGYLLNNFGVRFMGAAQASIIASTGPVITAVLAWAIIGAELRGIQGLGILIVTLGVVALGVEKLFAQRRAARLAKSAK